MQLCRHKNIGKALTKSRTGCGVMRLDESKMQIGVTSKAGTTTPSGAH